MVQIPQAAGQKQHIKRTVALSELALRSGQGESIPAVARSGDQAQPREVHGGHNKAKAYSYFNN